MSRIRSKNTKAELILRRILKGKYLRCYPSIYGNPDFGSKKRKIAIFLDGCFWHKCPKHFVMPKSNKKYWINKIGTNVSRDRNIASMLKKEGYKVIRVWEHDSKNNFKKTMAKILKYL
ncbi:very short patch repair endonuclease [Candidatus Woesearchaeota archaeon]|nr:very short patch repair endonuclease [Candidatus Woesearchaeota archaeon]